MFFGSRQGFGLEVEIDEVDPHRVDWIFGRLRFWAAGTTIGDFERSSMLSLPAAFFGDVLKRAEERIDPALCKQEAGAALSLVYDALYGPGDGDYQMALDLERLYRRFCIAPGGGEAFDGVFALLVACETGERLLWRTDEEGTPHEAWLGPGECEAVLLKFLVWLKAHCGFWPEGLAQPE